MDLLEREYQISLFETYEKLLTERQVEYFKAYYYEDYSLQEIAENYGVSRNAIYDQNKKTIQNLLEYEEKLHLLALKELLDKNLEEGKFKEEVFKLL